MKLKNAVIPAIAVAGLFASAASADIVAVGEFTGDYFEGMENISPPQGHTGGFGIFNNQAHVNDALTNQPWVTTNLNGPDGTILPYDGNFMGLAPTGWVTIDFDAPISSFGGFFSTSTIGAIGSIAFLDAAGDTIDILDFNVTAYDWSWQGWESDVAVHGIVLQTNEVPGAILVFDNLQMSLVPAPGALALLALGMGLGHRRRR